MQKESTLPAEIKNQVQNSGMELSVAESIASYYATFMTQAQEQSNLLKGLSHEKEEDVVTAKRIRLDLSKICSNVAKRKKEDKDILLVQTRYIDGLFKTVEGFARLTQKDAEEIEKHAERIEEAKLDDLEKTRNEKLEKFEIDSSTVDTRNMSNDVWQIYFKGVHDQYTQRKKAEAEVEARKIEAEKKRKIFDDRAKKLLVFDAFNVKYSLSPDSTEEEFNEMLQNCEDAKAKVINEQKEREAENKRLKEEADKAEQARQKEKKDAEKRQKAIEIKAKEASDEIKRLKDEREAEEKAKDEAEKKRLYDIAKEKKEAEDRAKAKAKAPDIEKLTESINALHLDAIDMTDEKVAEAQADIIAKFDSFKTWAKAKLQNCK